MNASKTNIRQSSASGIFLLWEGIGRKPELMFCLSGVLSLDFLNTHEFHIKKKKSMIGLPDLIFLQIIL